MFSVVVQAVAAGLGGVVLLLSSWRARAGCWVGGFNASICCDEGTYGPGGNAACWDDLYQFDPCCTGTSSLPGGGGQVAEEGEDSGMAFDAEALTAALGPKLEKVLAEVDGDVLEEDLRQTLASPENRTMFVRETKAYLAVLLRLRNRTEEADHMLQELAAERELDVSASGSWVGDNAKGYHMHDSAFALELVRFFWAEASFEASAQPVCNGRWPDCAPPPHQVPLSVVDFGCGLGLYVRDLRLAGLRAGGFDGNPATPAISEGRCQTADLSEASLDLGTSWDWALSLEVVEHIPDLHEEAFLRNLDRHNRRGIVLSWGNQPGHGHVNIRDTDYVERRLEAMGYTYEAETSESLRRAATLAWLQLTVMVFRRRRPEEEEEDHHLRSS